MVDFQPVRKQYYNKINEFENSQNYCVFIIFIISTEKSVSISDIMGISFHYNSEEKKRRKWMLFAVSFDVSRGYGP